MTAATRHRPGARTITPRPRPAAPPVAPVAPVPPPKPAATVVRRVTITTTPPTPPAVVPATRRPTRGHSVVSGHAVAIRGTITLAALVAPAYAAGLWFATAPLGVALAETLPWLAGAAPALGVLWLLGRTVARHCPGCRG